MTESRRDRVRQFLLDQFAIKRGLWGRVEQLLGRLFNLQNGTHVFEYSGCDAERRACAGDVVQAWVIDHEGVRMLEGSPGSVRHELYRRRYRFRRVCFYIDPTGEWVVESVADGPLSGYGGCFRVIPNGTSFRLRIEGSSWIS
jgi:hypothetical protein